VTRRDSWVDALPCALPQQRRPLDEALSSLLDPAELVLRIAVPAQHQPEMSDETLVTPLQPAQHADALLEDVEVGGRHRILMLSQLEAVRVERPSQFR
jgi:hypothetical protein